MEPPRPELLFVAGPQAGERAVLMTERGVVGRAETCEVRLKETYASRQQVRFEHSPEGWVVENLSARGTVISGKRYRAGKKVILETGDVLEAGLETKMLFVAAGDDPEEALRKYREAHAPGAEKLVARAAAEAVPTEAGAAEGKPPAAAPAAAVAPGAPLPVPQADQNEQKPAAGEAAEKQAMASRTKKIRRYVILLAVSSALSVGLIILLSSMPKSTQTDSTGRPRYLSAKEISDSLLDRPKGRSVNPIRAQEEIKKALDLYPRRVADNGDLYRIVARFNFYLQHKEGPTVFEDAEHNEKYNRACQELVEAATSRYNNARSYEGNRDWAAAEVLFRKLLVVVPEREPGSPAYEIFVRNVQGHLGYVIRQSRVQ